MTREGPIRPEMFLGEILRKYPSVRGKIKEFFGAECLQCESNERETIHYQTGLPGAEHPAQGEMRA